MCNQNQILSSNLSAKKEYPCFSHLRGVKEEQGLIGVFGKDLLKPIKKTKDKSKKTIIKIKSTKMLLGSPFL